MVLYIDQEQAVNLDYLKQLGVDTSEERFMLVQADDGIAALDTALTMMGTGLFSLIVIDSIPALITKQEMEGDVGAIHMAPLARLLSQTMKPIVQTAASTDTAFVFINQIRANLGFGGENANPGGNAIKFYPSLRIELKRIALLTKGDNNIGQTVRVNLVKTRFGFPYSKTDINLYFGKGIDKNEEILEVSIDKGIITRGGAYYTFPINETETTKLMGKEAVGRFLEDNPATKAYLEKLVIESLKPKTPIQELVELEPDFIEEDDV